MNKKLLLALFVIFNGFMSMFAQVIDGATIDSFSIHFTSDTISRFIPDTSTVPLWQIGHSYKSFFGADSLGTTTIMTDSLLPYPANANNWFVIKVPGNTIVDFWHKYQTDSTHAGGAVEFSLDLGVTWQNVKGPCNMDGGFTGSGVLTTNFYGVSDTLISGQPAFHGSTDSTIYSRFQFVPPPFERTTSGSECMIDLDVIFVRFRFLSDTANDSLAGWMIDSIKVQIQQSGGGVAKVSKPALHIYPNPSYDGIFYFPEITGEQQYTTRVYGIMGTPVLSLPYAHTVNLSMYPPGLYFYSVTNGVEQYAGKLLKE